MISDHSPRQILAKGIALVPQAHSLFPQMTVLENVELGAYTVRDAAVVRKRLRAVEELYPSSASARTKRRGASPEANSGWSSSLAA